MIAFRYSLELFNGTVLEALLSSGCGSPYLYITEIVHVQRSLSSGSKLLSKVKNMFFI